MLFNFRLDTELKEKTAENDDLNMQIQVLNLNEKELAKAKEQMQKTKLNNIELIEKFKVMDKELREAKRLKEVAEQHANSIEYEFEQQKKRFDIREKDLIAQIDDSTPQDTIKLLNEKNRIISEKSAELENQLWLMNEKFTNEMNVKNLELESAIKLQTKLQTEYDDLSNQLMDVIEENDKLKSNVPMPSAIDELKQTIVNLKNKLQIEEESKEKLQKQNESIECESEKLKNLHAQSTEKLAEKQNKIEKKEIEIESLRKELNSIESEQKELQAYCSQLSHENNLLENAYGQCRIIVQSISNELEILRVSYTELSMSVAEQELDHLKLQKTICDSDETYNFSTLFNATQNESSRIESKHLSTIKSTTVNEYSIEESEATQTEIQFEKINEQRYQELSRDYEIAKSSIIRLNETIDELNEKIKEQEEVECRLNERNNHLTEAIKQKNKIEAELSEATEALANQDEKIDELISKLDELEKSKAVNRNEIQRLNDLLGSSEENMESLKSEINLLKTKASDVDEYKNEIEVLKQKHAEKESELNNEISNKLDMLRNALADVDSLKTSLEHSTKQKNEIEAELEETKEALANRDEKIIALISNIDELEKSKAVSDNKTLHLNNLEENIESLKSEINMLKTKASDVDKYKNEIEILKQKHAEKELEWNNEIGKKLDAMADIDSLRTLLEHSTKQRNEIETELEEAKEAVANKDEKIDQLIANIDELEKSKAASDNEICRLDDLLSSSEGNIESLKSEIVMLQTKGSDVDDFKDRIEELKQMHADSELKMKNTLLAHDKLKTEIESNTKLHQIAVDDLKHKIAVLEDEQECLLKHNSDLKHSVECHKQQIERLKDQSNRISEMESQLATFGELNTKLTSEKQQLSEQLSCMQSKIKRKSFEMMNTPGNSRQSLSPKPPGKHVDIELLLRENSHLKSMQTSLENEVDELRRNTQNTRKIKRHSTHDDTRRISGFDACMLDIGTQSDPVSELCRCNEFSATIEKLRQDIILKDAQFSSFKMYTGVDSLKKANEKLKDDKSKLDTQYITLTAKYKVLVEKYEHLQLKHEMATTKPNALDGSTQTDVQPAQASANGLPFCASMDLLHAKERAENYKKAYFEKEKELKELKNVHGKLQDEYDSIIKQNVSTSTEHENMCRKIADQLSLAHDKYNKVKQIAEHRRNERIKLEETKNKEIQLLNDRLNDMNKELASKQNDDRTNQAVLQYNNIKSAYDRLNAQYTLTMQQRTEHEQMCKTIAEQLNAINEKYNKVKKLAELRRNDKIKLEETKNKEIQLLNERIAEYKKQYESLANKQKEKHTGDNRNIENIPIN